MALTIGTRVGPYEILAPIGAGGMGEVYRARDTKLNREVAIKALPEEFATDGERVARFEREAKLLASLNHPGIATVHGLEESNGLKYLAMELVPGETLAERISSGPLKLEECLEIFRQIAEALEAAHEKGIIHRDLKPANIIFTAEGRVKVLDFGLAKAVANNAEAADLSKSPTLTREGTEHGIILGTVSYMSPEQARGKTLDRRTDVWSFGCVFFEALAGSPAFSGETGPDIIAAILEKDPEWKALPARTPAGLRNLLRRCLQKDRRRRLRDIGDARIEIEETEREPAAPHVTKDIPWAPLALAVSVVMMLVLWAVLRSPGENVKREVSRFTVNIPAEQALTWWNDLSIAISPDGRTIVYVGGLGSERRLYFRPIDQLESRPIPGTENAATAVFSADGDWVVFYTSDRKLKKVRLESAAPITLTDVPNPWGASWGTGEDIVFAPQTSSGLSRVSASGGSPSVISTLDRGQGETSHRLPSILPDGKSALFTILTTEGIPNIGIVSLETGKHRVLLKKGFFARYVPTGHLVYTSGDTLLAAPFDLERLELTGESVPLSEKVWAPVGTPHYDFSKNGTLIYIPSRSLERTLAVVDRVGAARPLTEIRRAYFDPRLSPDGRRLSVTVEGHIWVHEMALDDLSRVTFGTDPHAGAIWTPDGKRLAFRRHLPSNVFWQPADGTAEAERLTSSENVQHPTSWSPDGKTLVYNEMQRGGHYDIKILTFDGDAKPSSLLDSPYNESGGVLSPDGQFLAYTSDETGRREVYVRTFPGSAGKWQISNEGGRHPVWARSGRELFYRQGDDLMVVEIEIEPAFHPQKPTRLFTLRFADALSLEFATYDVFPGDENFVVVQEDESMSQSQIHIVLNWFEELKRLVPTEN